MGISTKIIVMAMIRECIISFLFMVLIIMSIFLVEKIDASRGFLMPKPPRKTYHARPPSYGARPPSVGNNDYDNKVPYIGYGAIDDGTCTRMHNVKWCRDMHPIHHWERGCNEENKCRHGKLVIKSMMKKFH